MIIDARVANSMFERPPGVPWSTVENIANIHVNPNDTISIAKRDV